jgi:hypothetical protein
MVVSDKHNFIPDNTDVGMECCSSRTNLNILSSLGMKPSLSTSMTMPTPAIGTKINRAKIIATVVRIPSL